MKKIKSYITNLPKGVKILISINLIVYLISLIVEFIFSYDITKVLGIYATNDDRFHFYQFITNQFTHTLFIDHIFFNMLFFLIFAPNVENKVGTRNFVFLYLISGVIASILCNSLMSENYTNILNEYHNFKPKDLTEFEISRLKLKYSLNDNFSLGASGSIAGIMSSFLLLNILNWRKSLYNLFILYFIYVTILVLYFDYENSSIDLNHFGGLISGIILTTLYQIKKVIDKKISITLI